MKVCVFIAILAASSFAVLSAQAPPAATAPAAPAAGAQLAPETVVMNVDGHDVTVADVRAMLEREAGDARFGQMFQQNPQYAVQQFYVMRYLASEGDKAKLAEESPLKEQLQFMRENAVAGAMVNHQANSFSVNFDMVKDFYNKNQSRYEQAKIKIVFIAFRPSMQAKGTSDADLAAAARDALNAAHSATQRTEAEANTLAAKIVQDLRGGADFAKLVERYSEDPKSKAAGGDFGIVSQTSTSFPDEIKKAVLALKQGDVSDPIRQPTGFYIVRVEEKSAQPVEQLIGPIGDEIRQQMTNQWLQDVSTRFQPTKVNPDFFRMVVPQGPSATGPAPAAGTAKP